MKGCFESFLNRKREILQPFFVYFWKFEIHLQNRSFWTIFLYKSHCSKIYKYISTVFVKLPFFASLKNFVAFRVLGDFFRVIFFAPNNCSVFVWLRNFEVTYQNEPFLTILPCFTLFKMTIFATIQNLIYRLSGVFCLGTRVMWM